MKKYNIIKTREGLWKLEEVGFRENGEPYLEHIKLSGDKNVLIKLQKKLENDE